MSRSVVSFTVETDGKLPDRHVRLADAIAEVDAATDAAAAYFIDQLRPPGALRRGARRRRRVRSAALRGVKANASRLSHAELDEAPSSTTATRPSSAAARRPRTPRHPHLNVLGGCCGTDPRHLAAVAPAAAARRR